MTYVQDIARLCFAEFNLLLKKKNQKRLGDPETFIWWITHKVMTPPEGPLSTKFKLPCLDFDVQLKMPTLFNLVPLFQVLGVGNIVWIISQLLQEQPVILISNHFALIPKILQSFLYLLSPFDWTFPCISLLPSTSRDMLDAPGQLFIGCRQRFLSFFFFLFLFFSFFLFSFFILNCSIQEIKQ